MLHSNKSVPTFCHGRLGSCDGVNSSVLGELFMRQSGQHLTSSSSCLDNDGHHIECLALSRHLVIPWCPVWILSNMSRRGDNDSRTSHQQAVLDSQLCCHWVVRFRNICDATSLGPSRLAVLPYQPEDLVFLLVHSDFLQAFLTSWDALKNCTHVRLYLLLPGRLSSLVCLRSGARDSVSAVIRLFPGTWEMEKL